MWNFVLFFRSIGGIYITRTIGWLGSIAWFGSRYLHRNKGYPNNDPISVLVFGLWYRDPGLLQIEMAKVTDEEDPI